MAAPEIPAHTAWDTPRQVCITRGLRDAVCDEMRAHSLPARSQADLSDRAFEDDLITRGTVLNIVHQEGAELLKAQHTRAAAALEEHPQARALLLPMPSADADSDSAPDASPRTNPGVMSCHRGHPGERRRLPRPRRWRRKNPAPLIRGWCWSNSMRSRPRRSRRRAASNSGPTRRWFLSVLTSTCWPMAPPSGECSRNLARLLMPPGCPGRHAAVVGLRRWGVLDSDLVQGPGADS